MAAPPSSRLQNMLQAAVQSVQWTYSLFWQFSPQQGILVWGDGYYNGAIKTRKTVQPMEVSAEEASLQRSQQLRELYESLSAGETNNLPTRRPSVALSPEDLTESEWFYLMCVSFNFPPGVGLPGKAYARRQHVWLAGANEVDSKTFSRAILAKSACIQTVVCIPLLDGVVEFGNTDKVQEDLGFIQHVKGFFTEHSHHLRPKPALSEHSTSNPATSSDHLHFQSASAPVMYSAATEDTPIDTNLLEDEDEEEEEEDEQGSDLEGEAGARNQIQAETRQDVAAAAEPSELMQVDMSEDIRLGTPEDGSNNLDPLDFPLLGSEDADDHHHHCGVGLFRSESWPTWTMSHDPLSGCLELPPSGSHPLEDFMQEDSHYSQTVSTILQSQFTTWSETSSIPYTAYSNQSAFTKWTIRSDQHFHPPVEATSQWLLKYILFSVPYLHNKYREENSPRLRDSDAANRFRKGTPQEELSASHVLAERRRREKLNEKFIILRSLVPFVTKMDKASILGDTIEYLKQLLNKIQDLEACNRQMEMERQSRPLDPPQRTPSREQISGVTVMGQAGFGPGVHKRNMRIVERSGGSAEPKMAGAPSLETSIEVSIIETDALLELQCHHRDGLLLDIMQMLRELRIEITAVQSSLNNGFFVGELRAKVQDNVHGKRVSITEVKRLIRQIIPHE